ncbi:two-component system response regulator [Dechloromonas denitrificans]|uniref:Two-component system response regulator n=1 Tax=Dechloromonas denitrificans TaxID=281362 RepID=A0A133XH82_9RHOO|nr:response regulator [Dechloromonas denitrificans]KXB30301.1 two-component system response regulator [Dechloromonas denitrificans]
MHEPLSVFIVDDDASVRDALSLLLGIHDYRVAVFADAESFLKAYKKEWRGCLLLDIRMPGMDGLSLQKHLAELGSELPVIVMTGHGDVASAREAFRALAIDFLEKPLDHKKLLAGLAEAFSRQQVSLVAKMNQDQTQRLLGNLTPREREIMEKVVNGQHNREIAAELGISPRTVEVHKARMMDKLGVGNVADLVRLQLHANRG